MTQILLEYIAFYLGFVAGILLLIRGATIYNYQYDRGVGAQERECEGEYD